MEAQGGEVTSTRSHSASQSQGLNFSLPNLLLFCITSLNVKGEKRVQSYPWGPGV